jgi:hypothetical protein
VSGYEGKHRRPEGLPEAMRGLADLIEIVEDDDE